MKIEKNVKYRAKQVKVNRAFDNHLFGIQIFKYDPHTF